ncbi:hypothetical protein HAP47_0000380 [Bradyrhizobium sp. 41S5]|uniref:hypothetical protein n=1 Tax=Bradyrhizobium sp. 41S5 TaxID=1404443 RepID=UPI00156AF280|nr:hypothetical protein [Bradyrhizobium sp. 41S5]UFX45233.1 hypothetical protein HAP47_0000380 [Bradyrhizobium sp. 41S5]
MGDGAGYRHTGSDIARSSHSKSFKPVETVHGQKCQTKGALHPHLHGQMIDDETDTKLHLNGRSPNIHSGMATHRASAHERGIVAHVEDGSRHLRAAAVLGRQDRVGDDFDNTHVGHRVKKDAALPASPRGAQSQIMTKTDRRR